MEELKKMIRVGFAETNDRLDRLENRMDRP